MIEHFRIEGYRSIRDVEVEPRNLTVIFGRNGTGKSNLYRGLELIRSAAEGRLSLELAREGGMPSAMWAGAGWTTEENRETAARGRKSGKAQIVLTARIEHLSYTLHIGLPNPISDPALPLDPVVRKETIVAHAGGRKVTMLDRKGPPFATDVWSRHRYGGDGLWSLKQDVTLSSAQADSNVRAWMKAGGQFAGPPLAPPAKVAPAAAVGKTR